MKRLLVLIFIFLLIPLLCISQDNSDVCKPSHDSPGNDTPDDNFSSGTPKAENIPAYLEALPFIGIFLHGYHNSTDLLLNSLKRGCFYVKEEFDPIAILNNIKVLVIPSGGLYGMNNSEQLRSSFAEYVSNGGTIICFAQQYGQEFSVLPVPEGKALLAYGWREDQSCWTDAIYLDTWHPAVSSTIHSKIAADVDGHFTFYPENSTVLLRRTKNGAPAVLAYPYGEGWVVVTSLYEDWAVSHGQSSTRGRAIVRDLITWARNPYLEIPEYNLQNNLNPEVSLNLILKNISNQTAINAKIIWLDPDRNIIFEEERPVSLPTGEEITIPVSHIFNNILITMVGICHTDYILYNASGEEIQPQTETDSGRFVISKPPADVFELPKITANITVADEEVMRGSQADFQVHLHNHSDQDKNVFLYWDWSHGEKNYWDEAFIPANTSITKGISVDLPQRLRRNERFWVFIKGEDGKMISNASKGIWIIIPHVSAEIQTDKEYYTKGETVLLNISLNNLEDSPYDSTVNLRVSDPYNQIIYQDSFPIHFEAGGVVEVAKSFDLTQEANWGTYLIYLETKEANLGKIGSESSLFELPLSQLLSKLELPSMLQPNTLNTVSVILTNSGKVNVVQGVLDVKLLDPENNLVYQNQQIFSLPLNQSTTLNFNIPIPEIKFGNYSFVQTITDEFGEKRPFQEEALSELYVDLEFDKSSYRMRDEMNLSLNLVNGGKFLETVNATINIPSIEQSESKPIALNPAQVGNLSFASTIPLAIVSGLHPVEVTLSLPSGSEIKKSYSFAVPYPYLTATFDTQKDYSPGENLNFNIFNSGGLDTSYEYHVTLTDINTGIDIFSASNNGVVQAGGTVSSYFTLPSQPAKGEYLVKVELVDMNGKRTNSYKSIDILGLVASLEVKTDKDIYLNTENITSLSKVMNSDKEITEGKLQLKIVSKEPSLGEEWKYHYDPFYYCWAVGCDKDNNIWTSSLSYHLGKFNGTGWTLPLNKVKTLAQFPYSDYTDYLVYEDRENNIWIGNLSGKIVKYDGVSWTSFDSSNSGLSNNVMIYDVEVDMIGNTWFGTYKGVVRFDGTNWTTYDTSNSGLPADNVRAIAVDTGGNVWFATGVGGYFFGGQEVGVCKFDGTNWTTYDTSNSGIASNEISDIVVDTEGNLWFGTLESYKGVCKFDGTNWTIYDRTNSGLDTYYIYDIEVDQDGNLWFAPGRDWDDNIDKVYVFDGTEWTRYDSSNSCISQYVWHIVTDKEGNIWCAASYDTGEVYKFDGTNWTNYNSLNTGLITSSYVTTIIKDRNGKIWAGTEYMGLSQFDGISWITYNTSNSGLGHDWIRIIKEDALGNLWIGTSRGGVSKFDGTNWTVYNTSNSGLANDNVEAIEEDLEGDMWFGTYGGGVSQFDGTNWTTYTSSNSGLVDNRIYDIAEDSQGHLWFGTPKGASHFDGLNWTTYNSSNSGLVNNNVFSIAVDQEGNLWFGTYGGGVSKFDGTNWTTYNAQNSELGGDNISCIAEDSNRNLWFGYRDKDHNYGASKFDGITWTTYKALECGLHNMYIYGIIEDTYGNIWFAQSMDGIAILKEKKTSADSEPIWQTEIPVTLAAGQILDITTDVGALDYTGKFYLQGELLSSTGQKIDNGEYPFYITEGDTALLFAPDKEVYQQGDIILIEGEVKNLATIELANASLKIEKQSLEEESESEEIYAESFDVLAGASHPFSLTIPASEEGTFALTGTVTQGGLEITKASEMYDVSSPGFEVSVMTPEVVGLSPFDIAIELKNTGLIEGTVILDIQPSTYSEEVTVPAGETKLVISTHQIIQTTVFQINISGDYTEAITKNVLYGLGAQISVTPQAFYPEGRVEIPLRVANTGVLENEMSVESTLTLNGTPVSQLTKIYYLPFSQFIDDTLDFNLNPGDYTLAWSSLYGTSQASFQVKPLEQMAMAVLLGAQTDGFFPLNVSLINNGFNDFSGSISVESEVYSSLQDVILTSGSSNPFTFFINPNGIADGEHNLQVKLLRLDNTVVYQQTIPVSVTKPHIELTSIPTGLSFTIGENASFPFIVKNTGSKEGKAMLKVKVMDMVQSDDFYLGTGEEEEFSFPYLIPDDLPGGDYIGKYTLTQEETLLPLEGEFGFHVEGIDIDVEARLDKESYREGETAQLTLNITNNTQASFDLFVKVIYIDHEDEQSFTLDTSPSYIVFDIPLPQITEEKAFYGIYHKDGRGIHLNDIYIYKGGEEVEVLTDRQVYEPGETVQILINSTKAGLMRVEAPSYEEEFTIEGAISKTFTLPSDLKGGTYGVSWEFTPSDESDVLSDLHCFDVAGLKVVVTEASLDKGRYSPGDTIRLRVVFESNQHTSALMKIWVIDAEGSYTEASSKQVSLSSSEHTVAEESFTFETVYSGMHKVVYALYSLMGEELLVSGSEAFDVGGAVVLGVSTEERDYPLGTEGVKAFVNLFGEGEALLTLLINNVEVKSLTVGLNGVTMEEVLLEASLLGPGSLTLRAELEKGGLLSRKETTFTYGSILPDLTISSLSYEQENLLYTIKAHILNQGQSPSSSTSLAFYEGNPDDGGVLIGEKEIGTLEPGESAQVEAEWSGQGKSGEQAIYVSVDRQDAVKEFNEENNTSSLSLTIPDIFHELTLDKLTYSAYEDINIVTVITNNRETSVQGQLTLRITNLSSMSDVWEHSDVIAPIEPNAQSVFSNVYNLGPNPEGEYRVSQTAFIDGKEFIDEAIITILKTEMVAGTFTLDPSAIAPSQDEEVLVSIELQNRGNVGIEGGTLVLEIAKKETGQKVEEREITFDLDIAETMQISEVVTLNLPEGYYTVALLFKEDILDEKELEAEVQIAYTKQESLVPQVLIVASPSSEPKGKGWKFDKGKKQKYSQLDLIEQALQEAGIHYRVETHSIYQIREFRSGAYNITLILDMSLLFPHVAQEIKERVWKGEGVVAVFTHSWNKEFLRELFGVKARGSLSDKKKTIETLESPVSTPGEFELDSEFMRIEPKAENLIIAAREKGREDPLLTLNYYGAGKAILFGFALTAQPDEPAFSHLKQLVLNSINYLKPQTNKEAVISRLVPVELTFQNPTSSAIQLKIAEEIPQDVRLISAEPEPPEQEPLTWLFTLEPSSFTYLRYEVELPDLKGEYQLKTSIIKLDGEEELLIDTPVLTYKVEKTVREMLLEAITEIEKLPVSSFKDRRSKDMAVRHLTRILNRDETQLFAWHKNLYDMLVALGSLEQIETANPSLIRKSLVDMMLYYERRTVNDERKMKLIFPIDLEKLK